MKKVRLPALALTAALLVAACGGDDDDGGSGDGGGGGGGDGLSLDQVKLAIDNDDYMNQLAWMIADDKYWPDLGFTKKADVVASDEYIAGLVGGSVWIAQGESDVIWSALAEGSVPMKIVGVEKDTEAWFLGIREGVDKDSLEGLKISGGPAGDRNITVGEKILDELGVDPESMEWVQIEGGSDDRLQALIAGQIDVAVLQPRHLLPLDEANGEMIFQEYKDVPQEVWVVKSETMEDNKDAVCAYLEGRIAAKQWASEGEEFTDNQDAAVAIGEKYDLEPTEGDLDEWQAEMEYNWALTGGAPLDAFEQWNEDMIANGNVPDGFDWKEHVDFSCLTQAQENLGLEVQPGDV
jgi:ABC-type nitrate/sulfonate/bicarbonate transport system substrate-binding protein